MEFRLTAEQELWKNTVREFAEAEIEPISRKIDAEWEAIPDELINKMADLGIFGVAIPEEYGGMAMPGEEMQFARITIHEIARAELSMSLPVYTLLCIGCLCSKQINLAHHVVGGSRRYFRNLVSVRWWRGLVASARDGASTCRKNRDKQNDDQKHH